MPDGGVLWNRRWSLRGIQPYGLHVALNINVAIRPHAPAQGPVNSKVIPDIDIVVYNDRDLAEARSHRPDAVHELSYLTLELLVQ